MKCRYIHYCHVLQNLAQLLLVGLLDRVGREEKSEVATIKKKRSGGAMVALVLFSFFLSSSLPQVPGTSETTGRVAREVTTPESPERARQKNSYA